MSKKETIRFILKQFKLMGATSLQIKEEFVKMMTDEDYLIKNMKLLDLEGNLNE